MSIASFSRARPAPQCRARLYRRLVVFSLTPTVLPMELRIASARLQAATAGTEHWAAVALDEGARRHEYVVEIICGFASQDEALAYRGLPGRGYLAVPECEAKALAWRLALVYRPWRPRPPKRISNQQ